MGKNNLDEQYKNLLKKILVTGKAKGDRTGTGTISIFDSSMSIDMSEGFPLLTSKKMFTKGIIYELLWFLNGDTNIKYLVNNNVNIWNGDAYKNYCKYNYDLTMKEFIYKIKNDDIFSNKWGELGPIYGKQWTNWNGINQIKELVDNLINNPDSRRLMVSAWNVEDNKKVVLPPCHYGFQCYTYEMSLNERLEEWCKSLGKSIHYSKDLDHKYLDDKGFPKRKLSLKWNQRSIDFCLGLPFNIASYGFLLHMLAQQTNMLVDKLIMSGGDTHIYKNHVELSKTQLENVSYKLPTLELNKAKDIFSYNIEDFKILNYESSGKINYPLSN